MSPKVRNGAAPKCPFRVPRMEGEWGLSVHPIPWVCCVCAECPCACRFVPTPVPAVCPACPEGLRVPGPAPWAPRTPVPLPAVPRTPRAQLTGHPAASSRGKVLPVPVPVLHRAWSPEPPTLCRCRYPRCRCWNRPSAGTEAWGAHPPVTPHLTRACWSRFTGCQPPTPGCLPTPPPPTEPTGSRSGAIPLPTPSQPPAAGSLSPLPLPPPGSSGALSSPHSPQHPLPVPGLPPFFPLSPGGGAGSPTVPSARSRMSAVRGGAAGAAAAARQPWKQSAHACSSFSGCS